MKRLKNEWLQLLILAAPFCTAARFLPARWVFLAGGLPLILLVARVPAAYSCFAFQAEKRDAERNALKKYMPSYLALLRGINVSGHKPVKMDRLRAAFEALGFSAVQTYLQSGNVVFQAPQKSATGLSKKIAAQILANFGFSVTILIRTPAEWGEICKRNPFAQLPENDAAKLYVTFLSQPAPGTAAETLPKLAGAAEQIYVHEREIYLYCPAGYGNTKLSNAVMEKKLSVSATTRNWRTVNALFEMVQPNNLR